MFPKASFLLLFLSTTIANAWSSHENTGRSGHFINSKIRITVTDNSCVEKGFPTGTKAIILPITALIVKHKKVALSFYFQAEYLIDLQRRSFSNLQHTSSGIKTRGKFSGSNAGLSKTGYLEYLTCKKFSRVHQNPLTAQMSTLKKGRTPTVRRIVSELYHLINHVDLCLAHESRLGWRRTRQ